MESVSNPDNYRVQEDVITKIEANWFHGYANDPTVKIHVDRDIYKEWEWLYEPITINDVGSNPFPCMLYSDNNAPWVKFVYIDNPDGNPSQHGALGGEYTLYDGSVIKSRTGWSSRA